MRGEEAALEGRRPEDGARADVARAYLVTDQPFQISVGFDVLGTVNADAAVCRWSSMS